MDILTLETNLNEKEEILSHVSKKLLELSYVSDEYEQSLLERENEYPTGLEITDEFKVAIPHTDIKYVKKEALVVIKPKNPPKFRKMDDPQTEIPVNIIFLLVIKHPDGYVKFLAKLTELFGDSSFIATISKGSLKDIEELLRVRLFQK